MNFAKAVCHGASVFSERWYIQVDPVSMITIGVCLIISDCYMYLSMS